MSFLQEPGKSRTEAKNIRDTPGPDIATQLVAEYGSCYRLGIASERLEDRDGLHVFAIRGEMRRVGISRVVPGITLRVGSCELRLEQTLLSKALVLQTVSMTPAGGGREQNDREYRRQREAGADPTSRGAPELSWM